MRGVEHLAEKKFNILRLVSKMNDGRMQLRTASLLITQKLPPIRFKLKQIKMPDKLLMVDKAMVKFCLPINKCNKQVRQILTWWNWQNYCSAPAISVCKLWRKMTSSDNILHCSMSVKSVCLRPFFWNKVFWTSRWNFGKLLNGGGVCSGCVGMSSDRRNRRLHAEGCGYKYWRFCTHSSPAPDAITRRCKNVNLFRLAHRV